MLETAAQEQCRRRIPEAAWTAFDIEFSRLKIKTWIFVVLWGFLGNFGGHLIYMWIKKGEFPVSGAVVFGYVMCWSKILGNNESQSATATAVLTVGVLIHGIYFLASGALRRINDEIAAKVASQVR